MKKNSFGISQSIKNKLLISELILLVLLLILAFCTNLYVKKQNAKQISRIVSRMLKKGDRREAIYSLASAKLESFSSILLFDKDKNNIFSLPSKGDFEQNVFVYYYIDEFIYFDSDSKEIVGVIRFYYNYIYSLIFAMFIWFLSLLMTIPIFKKYFKLSLDQIITEEKRFFLQKAEEKNKQIFHDLNSPLVSLKHVIESIEYMLPNDKKITLYEISKRITDIVNTMSYRKTTDENVLKCENILIVPLLEQIISEKRVEYKNLNLIHLDDQAFCSTHVKINKTEFSRCISNIVNNAIEATLGKMSINIHIRNSPSIFTIKIVDLGCGMSSETVQKAILGGFTTKHNGNGIGLSSAKKIIEQYRGTFNIESALGEGTSVTINLPIVSSPEWFSDRIIIHKENIICVDDDLSFRDVYRNRLSQYCQNIFIFDEHTKNLKQYFHNSQFFLDYDLGGEETGLDLILKYNLSDRSILVTSLYQDKMIQKTCLENNIKIIPKQIFSKSEIVKQEKDIYVVLIDDDELIHKTWKMGIKNQNDKIILRTYYRVSDFLNEAKMFPSHTNVYIDSNLADGKKGEIESEKIHHAGFNEIYLATGYSKEDFKKIEWIKDIVGKEVPKF